MRGQEICFFNMAASHSRRTFGVKEDIGCCVFDFGSGTFLHVGVVGEEPSTGRLVQAVGSVVTAVVAAVVFHYTIKVVNHAAWTRTRVSSQLTQVKVLQRERHPRVYLLCGDARKSKTL